ncbi:MAG: DUF2267 domain-containing protein [Pseudomonadota bacterium]
MSETGLRQLDETIQTTHAWLNDIMSECGTDRQTAYRALKAVLQTLRDRLTVEEAAHLGAQLPMLVRGFYYDSYKPARQPHKSRTPEEFLDEVERHLSDARPIDIASATRVVLKVLERHVSPGEVKQVKAMLPRDIRDSLWH